MKWSSPQRLIFPSLISPFRPHPLRSQEKKVHSSQCPSLLNFHLKHTQLVKLKFIRREERNHFGKTTRREEAVQLETKRIVEHVHEKEICQ